MITSFSPSRPRLSSHFERMSQTFCKKIPAKKIFSLFSKKQYLSLPLNSWATFAEAHKLKKHNEIANFAMFLSMKCWKFQNVIRMSKNAAGVRILLVSYVGHPRTS